MGENVGSNARPRKSDFTSQTVRTYSPFMNRDVSKTDVSGSNETVCKMYSFRSYSRGELL